MEENLKKRSTDKLKTTTRKYSIKIASLFLSSLLLINSAPVISVAAKEQAEDTVESTEVTEEAETDDMNETQDEDINTDEEIETLEEEATEDNTSQIAAFSAAVGDEEKSSVTSRTDGTTEAGDGVIGVGTEGENDSGEAGEDEEGGAGDPVDPYSDPENPDNTGVPENPGDPVDPDSDPENPDDTGVPENPGEPTDPDPEESPDPDPEEPADPEPEEPIEDEIPENDEEEKPGLQVNPIFPKAETITGSATLSEGQVIVLYPGTTRERSANINADGSWLIRNLAGDSNYLTEGSTVPMQIINGNQIHGYEDQFYVQEESSDPDYYAAEEETVDVANEGSTAEEENIASENMSSTSGSEASETEEPTEPVETLPETGESVNGSALGIASLTAGLGLMFIGKKKETKEA